MTYAVMNTLWGFNKKFWYFFVHSSASQTSSSIVEDIFQQLIPCAVEKYKESLCFTLILCWYMFRIYTKLCRLGKYKICRTMVLIYKQELFLWLVSMKLSYACKRKKISEEKRKNSCQNLTILTFWISLVCTILKISGPFFTQS